MLGRIYGSKKDFFYGGQYVNDCKKRSKIIITMENGELREIDEMRERGELKLLLSETKGGFC